MLTAGVIFKAAVGLFYWFLLLLLFLMNIVVFFLPAFFFCVFSNLMITQTEINFNNSIFHSILSKQDRMSVTGDYQ